ncbi:MAG: GspE/PulE family protein [Campylobacter sp.]|uniref:GspE/PulE family protein n=1 Tax=Campylobacter sp. TaxID=205 RepID=UPI002A86596A|nr:GspE/PulE family protein [Campylobacter sp.]MDD6161317.1 GspE/PulE family protein [Campylobacteraceae bacterium]MCI6344687.1 GspE/PulE family protein [Campylobacter sp.]MCI6695511.1 GspE/PulE family protein [Campylobacter sp.]MCI7363222.1 GspE/PulE family protein [Campylobacter sp.]MCI7463674.1 GspE/PulE family protein [Campylobacter sp.]
MASIIDINKEITQALQKSGKFDEAVMASFEAELNESNTRALLEEKIGLNTEGIMNVLALIYRRGRINIDEVCGYFALDRVEFLKYFAQNFKFEYSSLDEGSIDYNLARKIPSSQLKRLGVLPLKEDKVNVYVAFRDLFDVEIQEQIANIFNRKILKVVVCDTAKLDKVLSKMELNESVSSLIAQIRQEISRANTDDGGESSAILRLIETILKTAISSRASDIHIESSEKNCIVRCRIDGMLAEIFVFDKDIYPPLVSRLKMLSNLDIAEQRKPQDGRFSVQVLGRDYDFRISTLPVIHGESVVMRILDKSKAIIKLSELGMLEDNLAKFSRLTRTPYGVLLVTGPTGSGKTTTLYAALNDIKSVETKMITVEDPVEYQMDMIQQVNVNVKAGLTFANSLRSILRQDPDVIMIGEIRDQETLRIAIQAALTGHLVFSTLHTNDAISAVARVVEMGIEPYLVSGALIGVEAQRLVRKLCPHCKQKITLPPTQLDGIIHLIPDDFAFYAPVGCDKCSQTGYLGREMISEVLPISDKISSLIAKNATKEELKSTALAEGFKDFFTDGIRRAAMGITSIQEVYRVAKS